MIIRDYWRYLIRNHNQINYILFVDYWIDYLPQIIPIIKKWKQNVNTSSIFDKDFNPWHQLFFDLFVIIWWLFDDYLMIIWCVFVLLWLFVTLKCYSAMFTTTTSRCKNVNANDSPVFAFARLCCLTIPADRPARSVKIVSDLLVSSLHSAPHARLRWTHHTQLSPWGRAGDLGREKEG